MISIHSSTKPSDGALVGRGQMPQAHPPPRDALPLDHSASSPRLLLVRRGYEAGALLLLIARLSDWGCFP